MNIPCTVCKSSEDWDDEESGWMTPETMEAVVFERIILKTGASHLIPICEMHRDDHSDIPTDENGDPMDRDLVPLAEGLNAWIVQEVLDK